ncbi:hypothetical protein LCD31_08050, partial [Saccharopolyspora sp. 6M]|nr:hypothetical protein [Saccharopolyspora sp. 6M]
MSVSVSVSVSDGGGAGARAGVARGRGRRPAARRGSGVGSGPLGLGPVARWAAPRARSAGVSTAAFGVPPGRAASGSSGPSGIAVRPALPAASGFAGAGFGAAGLAARGVAAGFVAPGSAAATRFVGSPPPGARSGRVGIGRAARWRGLRSTGFAGSGRGPRSGAGRR